MTYLQIITLLVLGPFGFIGFCRGLIVLIHGKGEYSVVEALVTFACVVAILVAFLGVT